MRPLRPWIPTALLLVLLLALTGGSVWLHPATRQLGSGASEGPIHLWSLWVAAEGLFSSGPLLRIAPEVAFPDGFAAHLMDPVSLLLFLPGFLLGGGGAAGASLGWNLLHAGAVLIAGLGAYRLARVLDPDPDSSPWTAALMVAGVAGGSFLLSHPWFGRTELLALVLMPLHLALLLPWVRGDGGWRTGLGAGLLLGGVALGGGYAGVFALLLELPLGLWLLAVSRQRRRVLGRLALVAGIALLLASPAVLALLAYPPLSFGSLSDPAQFTVPSLTPGQLAWVLRLERPGAGALLMDQPVYPGVVLLALAGIGAALRPRRALLWLLLGLWLLVLALGRELELGGGEALPLPAALLAWLVPALAYIKFWSRLGILVPLPLAVAAGLGLAAMLRRCPSRLRPVLGLVLVAAVLADQATWPRPWAPRPAFEAAMPAELGATIDALPPGALMHLPLEVPTAEGQLLETGFSILWSRQHDRAVTATPAEHGDQLLQRSNLARFAVNLQAGLASGVATSPGDLVRPGADGEASAREAGCLRRDAAVLAELGLGGLVLHIDRPGGPALAAVLEDALGGPTVRGDRLLAWDPAAVTLREGDGACSLFGLHPVASARLAGLEEASTPSVLLLVVPDPDAGALDALRRLAARGVRFEGALRSEVDLEADLEAVLDGGGHPLQRSLAEAGYLVAEPGRSRDSGDTPEPAQIISWLAAAPDGPWLAAATLRGGGAELPAVLDAVDAMGSDAPITVVVAGARGGGLPAAEALRDPQLAVELVVADPGLGGGWVVDRPVQLSDLGPTLRERAGLEPGNGARARSLVPQLRGDTPLVSGRPMLVEAPDGVALRTPGHKLIVTDEGSLLFDLEADPGELHDLAAEQPALLQRLTRQLEALREPAALPSSPSAPAPGSAGPAHPLARLAALEDERAALLADIAQLEGAEGASETQELERLRKRLHALDIKIRPLLKAREDAGGGGAPGRR